MEEGLLGDEVLVRVHHVLHVLFVHQGAVEVGVGGAGQVHPLIALGQRLETVSKAQWAVRGFLAGGGGQGSLRAGACVCARLVTIPSPRSLPQSGSPSPDRELNIKHSSMCKSPRMKCEQLRRETKGRRQQPALSADSALSCDGVGIYADMHGGRK